MIKHIFLCILAAQLIVGRSFGQTYLPIASNGYSLDGVAENTTAVSTTGGALDASDFVLYSQYYGTLYSTTATGLPNNGLIASGTRTYQLQPYNGYNVLHLFAGGQDSLNFITPQAYPTISLLGFGTQGVASASITIRFTDNTTQVFPSISMDDWFGTSTAAYVGFDRALRTSGVPAYVGSAPNPKFFAFDLAILCANQAKAIKSVKIMNNSTSAHVCVMAVAGAVPAYSISATPGSLCLGSSATLSAIGLTTYSWQPVGNFAGSNAATVVITPTATNTYTLLGDNAGCPAYASASIVVSGGLPSLTFSGTTASVCLGAAATISVTGALTYTLSNSLLNGVPFTPTGTAVYTVSGANGCGITTSTVNVSVAPLPVTASTPTLLVCAGFPATLSAGGASTYTWLPGNGQAANYVVSPFANTTYTVIGKTGNCVGTNTINLTTKPVPSIILTAASSSICVGDSVNLSVSGNALTYTWGPGNQTGTSIYVKPITLSLFYVVGTNSVNCTGTAQQAIFVNPNPVISVAALNPTVCSAGACTLTASGASNYTWNSVGGGNTTVINPLATTIVTVTGSFTTGCSGTNTAVVTVNNATVSVSANTFVCSGSTVVISAGTALSYTWSNSLPGQQFVMVGPSLTTIYTVSASVMVPGSISCKASNTVQVSVYPNPSISISGSRSSSSICVGESIRLTASGAGASGTYTWNTGVSSISLNVNPTTTKTYSVSGTDANGCMSSGQYIVKVITCTGIDKYTEIPENVWVFPNPSNGSIYIKGNAAAEVSLSNELGQIVQTFSLSEANAFEVKVDHLQVGIYFAHVNVSGRLSTQKILVSN